MCRVKKKGYRIETEHEVYSQLVQEIIGYFPWLYVCTHRIYSAPSGEIFFKKNKKKFLSVYVFTPIWHRNAPSKLFYFKIVLRDHDYHPNEWVREVSVFQNGHHIQQRLINAHYNVWNQKHISCVQQHFFFETRNTNCARVDCSTALVLYISSVLRSKGPF